MSQKDIEICLNCDIEALRIEAPSIGFLHQRLQDLYPAGIEG